MDFYLSTSSSTFSCFQITWNLHGSAVVEQEDVELVLDELPPLKIGKNRQTCGSIKNLSCCK